MGIAVLVTLTVLTWAQVGSWRDRLTLWEHAVRVTPDNDWAHQHLSLCYRRRGQLDEARFHLAEAHRIQRRRHRAK
jgi:hypothetical protein